MSLVKLPAPGSRRSLDSLTPYLWVSASILLSCSLVRGYADLTIAFVSAYLSVRCFAALEGRNRRMASVVAGLRWMRRADDAYFDAVRRGVEGLTEEERRRFDDRVRDGWRD